ncbi:MAG: hypothetical protein ACK6DZ_10275 [Acidobacteriota bacterium]
MKLATLAGVILSVCLVCAGQTAREPRSFFREKVGLSDDQIDMIARGQAVVKMLPSKTPAEIFIFGAVFVNANPDEYAKFAFDMSRLRRLPSYLGVGRLSDPPLIGDSGPKRTGFLGEGENRSGVKANTIPGPTRTKIPAGTRMVFVPPRTCFRDGPE